MDVFLITGGAGFIGCHFIDYMFENFGDCKIVCVDKLTYAGKRSNIARFLGKNFVFYKNDICNRAAMEKIFAKEKPSAVINFAAESHVDRSFVNPGVFFKTNVMGTRVLLDVCIKYGVKRFHQVSTDEVYGGISAKDFLTEGSNLTAFTEKSPLTPTNPYSASKAAADLLVLSYGKSFDICVTVSRGTNNYGLYQYPEKLIPLTVKRALANEKIPVYGRGEEIRDWLCVKDHCAAIGLILKNGESGEIYNVCGNNKMKNIQVVKKIIGLTNRPQSLIMFVPQRVSNDECYNISDSKIREKLGWMPVCDFDKQLKEIVDNQMQSKGAF